MLKMQMFQRLRIGLTGICFSPYVLFCFATMCLKATRANALLSPSEQTSMPISSAPARKPTGTFSKLMLVVNTWPFTDATDEAWKTLQRGGSLLDAVEAGCNRCERDQCDGSVGYGNHPDETGEVTLDAMIMNGNTMEIGSVGALRQIKSAVSVARRVMENTRHTLLVGELATQFAVQMGFVRENLSTNVSDDAWLKWKSVENKCQPNFWQNVLPDASTSCGPYKPKSDMVKNSVHGFADRHSHDTIGLIALNVGESIACGTSTNGAIFRIPGRVGDSPIVGAGAYCDAEIGGAVETGDGDIMMRFVPSAVAVERMASGDTPQQAAQYVIDKIRRRGSNSFSGAVLAVSASTGEIGAACHGFKTFPYSFIDSNSSEVGGQAKVVTITCS